MATVYTTTGFNGLSDLIQLPQIMLVNQPAVQQTKVTYLCIINISNSYELETVNFFIPFVIIIFTWSHLGKHHWGRRLIFNIDFISNRRIWEQKFRIMAIISF